MTADLDSLEGTIALVAARASRGATSVRLSPWLTTRARNLDGEKTRRWENLSPWLSLRELLASNAQKALGDFNWDCRGETACRSSTMSLNIIVAATSSRSALRTVRCKNA